MQQNYYFIYPGSDQALPVPGLLMPVVLVQTDDKPLP
jgi:hypothetical protein